METIGADMTTHLATHATTNTIIEMTGVANAGTIDVMTIEMTDTMNTDIADVTGVIVTTSGLGDNSIVNLFTPV